MKTCCQVGCDSPAEMAFHWPGARERSHVCEGHALRAREIAHALGFVLSLEITSVAVIARAIEEMQAQRALEMLTKADE